MNPDTLSELGALCAALDHRFEHPELLDQALRHRSWSAENAGAAPNERLEFLGDSVLGLVITDRLYRAAPDLDEGELAQRRAELVNARTLADVAVEVGLGAHLRLGRGEAASGGREKASILADATEAVLGAVYLDAGIGAASELIERLWGPRIDEILETGSLNDHKSRLQELAARLGHDAPHYDLAESGPDHHKEFTATVAVGPGVVGVGVGRTKKAAEQAAAAEAMVELAAEDPLSGTGEPLAPSDDVHPNPGGAPGADDQEDGVGDG